MIFILSLFKRLSPFAFYTSSILYPSAQMFCYNSKDGILDISVVRNSTDSAVFTYICLHINRYKFPFQEINVFI